MPRGRVGAAARVADEESAGRAISLRYLPRHDVQRWRLAAGARRGCVEGHLNCAVSRVGFGRDAVEAIADLLSIARLPPGHDPGAGYGVATAARQRWHLAIRHFGLFGGLLAAAND